MIHSSRSADAFINLSQRFARRGYVAVSINYRTVTSDRFAKDPVSAMMDVMYDAKAAVRWLRANAAAYRVDAERIGIGGGSAGAFTALHAAYGDGEGTSGNAGYSSRVSAVVDFWGGMYDFADMETGEAPLVIIHGTDDKKVPYSYAEKLVSRAEAVGVSCELHPLEGTGHAAWEGLETYISWIAPFLYRYVASR